MLQQARQPNTFILFGTFSFQRVFHTPPPTAPFEHSTQSFSLDNLRATWYLVRTEYLPDFSASQISVSEVYLWLRGMHNIGSASSLLKLRKTRPLSHPLEISYISSTTLIPSSIFWTWCSTLFVGEFGSQASSRIRVVSSFPTLQHDLLCRIGLATMMLFHG